VLPAPLRRVVTVARRLNPVVLSRTQVRLDELIAATRELTRSVNALRTKTDQLAAIEQADWDGREAFAELPATLDTEALRAHIARALDRAKLEMDPYPHVVVEKWLPGDVYRLMVDGLPAPVFFADKRESRERLSVPFRLAPKYSKHIWQLITRDVVGRIAGPLINQKFNAVVRDYIHSLCPNLPAEVDVNLAATNGHIMLRRPGYVIDPHRDPKWGFVICLVYLARPGDSETYGTQIYRVKDDVEAPNSSPYYVEHSRCELVKSVPFRANSLLLFLNSAGAHGASIPADAQPPNLERYLYQFRLRLEPEARAAMLAHMSDEGRARWRPSDTPIEY
jgi:hypothetical protein